MIPVPGLDSVRCAWVEIRAEGFALHGFLVFLASDRYFPHYLDGDGLADLDSWTGHEIGVFVVQSPSAKWIEYAKATDHVWWHLFGQFALDKELEHVLVEYGDTPLPQANGSRRSLKEVFAPCFNQFQYDAEIEKILRRFNLKPTDHPSLILFKDLKDRRIWFVDMADLVDIPERDLRESLRRWFAGPEFRDVMKDARHA